jgi:hypothetical protein
MREIRPYGSEGGVALTTPLLPLSPGRDATLVVLTSALALPPLFWFAHCAPNL